MFDIGFGEIFLIAVVALLVLGPERLPKAARFAGLWVRRARAQWYSVKAEFENELADEELRRSLQQTQADLREAREALEQGGTALKRQVEQAGADVRNAFHPGQYGGAADIEPPQASATDAAMTGTVTEQPELPLADTGAAAHGDDEHGDRDAHDTEHRAGSGHHARR